MESQNQDNVSTIRAAVSAIIVSYNREHLIGAVLQAVQFCDEVILVDKSSTDHTREVAAPFCDKIVQVAWSPTVEETRSDAVAMAANDWIVMLDDDEILNPAAVAWIQKELESPRALVYGIPQRHYIIGIHDPEAYYWPEHQIRFFNRNAVTFTDTVHGGIQTDGDGIHWIDITTGAGIEHLSHPDVETWIEKANRYTSRPDRVRPNIENPDLLEFTKDRLDFWAQKSRIHRPGDYAQAAALLRSVYDIIDRLKMWEEAHGVVGYDRFLELSWELSKQHLAARLGQNPLRRGEIITKSSTVDSSTTQEKKKASGHQELDHSEKEILESRLKIALSRNIFLEEEVKTLKDEVLRIVPVERELRGISERNRMLEIQIRQSTFVGRVKQIWGPILTKHPRLLWIVSRILKVITLIRQGKFLSYLRNYASCHCRQFIENRRIIHYQATYFSKIDPDGSLKALEKNRMVVKPGDLHFVSHQKPVVSIVIPCYGKSDYTLRCLHSLFVYSPEMPYEIIVVEDASGDPDSAKLRDVRGITYIERKENLGFLRSCNDAATHARGEYIFLLNNDTYVLRGAIDALAELLRKRPDAGMVGARLIYPDGIQQEAGGIVWQDGSAWNYGRRDSPFKPQYSYVRDADYISGAAIMLSRDLWKRLDGFDEHYLPAYCEDSDLAFRIRREGLKVLYQPEAWIVHCEGVSHGTDTNIGMKAYQVENTKKLKERWKDVLFNEHFPHGTHIMRARDKAMKSKITLVIDHYVPEPDCDAGSRTMVAFMDTLLETGRVVKFWPDNGRHSTSYTEALQQRGIEVLCGATMGGFTHWIKENGSDIDEVLISRPTVAPSYISLLREHTRASIVFYGHDLHHARMMREADISKDPATKVDALAIKQKEIAVWKQVDYSLYPSEEEIDALHAIEASVPAGAVSAYAFSEARPKAPPTSNGVDILFVAGFAHSPNVDAAVWFHDNVLPLIWSQKPNIRLTLVGSKPTEKVKSLAGDKIKVTGFVTDTELADYYRKARVAIAPLRFGAGVKLKVVEGMHAGIPLVTTSIGAQGLKNLNGALEICDDAQDFANAILKFLEDDNAWKERSALQVKYVNQNFSRERQKRDLEDAFARARKNRKG